MIVDGTLSANAVNANDVRTKTLLVESSMVLGTSGTTASSSNKGKIYSAGKSYFGSGTNGFFLGWEGNGEVAITKLSSILEIIMILLSLTVPTSL